MIWIRKERSFMTALTLKSLLEFGFQVLTLNYGKFLIEVKQVGEGVCKFIKLYIDRVPYFH